MTTFGPILLSHLPLDESRVAICLVQHFIPKHFGACIAVAQRLVLLHKRCNAALSLFDRIIGLLTTAVRVALTVLTKRDHTSLCQLSKHLTERCSLVIRHFHKQLLGLIACWHAQCKASTTGRKLSELALNSLFLELLAHFSKFSSHLCQLTCLS